MANAVLEYVCLVHYKTILITKSGGDISLSDSDIILGHLLEPSDIGFISFSGVQQSGDSSCLINYLIAQLFPFVSFTKLIRHIILARRIVIQPHSEVDEHLPPLQLFLNSLTTGRSEWKFIYVVLKLISVIDGWVCHCLNCLSKATPPVV